MIRHVALVVCDRAACITLGLIVGAFAAAGTGAQPSGSQLPAPAQQAQAAPPPRVLTSDAGLVLNFIKPDKTKDFEAILLKLKEALASSAKPARKAQAKGWRVYKSLDPAAGGSALYVFFVDPPVKDADYTVTAILAESLPPEEMTQIAKQYVDAYASGQNFVNLALLGDLSK